MSKEPSPWEYPSTKTLINFTLRAYSDSEWAGCKTSRRSTGGFCTFLGENLISWSSKKQQTISKVQQKLNIDSFMTLFLPDLGVKQPITPELYCDNMYVVQLSANPVFHTRSKHFETHYHYVREHISLGSLVVKHVPTFHQLVDIFTKSLPRAPFFLLIFKLGFLLPPNQV